MADYYSLLEKAIAKLKDPSPEARQAVYERARRALSGQLRSLDPPLQEEAIEREAQALEIAIAQLETQRALPAASQFAGNPDLSRPPSVAGSAVVQPPAHVTVPEAGSLAWDANSKNGAAPPPIRDSTRPAPPPPLRFRRKSAEQQPGDSARPQSPLSAGSVRPRLGAGPDSPFPEASSGDNLSAQAHDLGPAESGAISGGTEKKRLESRQSFMFEPEEAGKHKRRLVAVGAIASVIAIVVAAAAYRLRDRPEDLLPLAAPPGQTGGAESGKIADRIDAGKAAPNPLPQSSPAPSAAGYSEAARTAAVPANPPLAVARRAALLVQSKDEKTKVNTYIGTVVWRAENVSDGPDEPLQTAIHALIEIPELKFRADVLIQKNLDSTLPASHTVKLVFALPADSALGSIKQISTLYMRQEDTPVGDPLKGITVPIVDNSFLIGLARGDAEASNIEQLKSREWLDVPMVLGNGLSAKLTFEKGPSGQRIFDDATASWQAK
ncbi:MAG: hypothetical protein J2P49_04455 [Methylocapsa sp.]|nr:hypothetical protein [Methylocapsa sp.]